MTDQNVAPRDRSRLTRRNPGARLARDLLKTEYGLRDQGRGGAGRAAGDNVWERLLAELRRLMNRFTGGSRPAPAGGGPAPGGDQGGGQGDGSFDPAAAPTRGGPGQMPPTTPPPTGPAPAERPFHAGMARLEERIRRLPAHEREAFEDTVLHLVRTDRKYRKAYDTSPADMPSVALYANNAYVRELRRDAPPGTPTAEQAMAAARDSIMARDQEQFALLRERWERRAPGLGDTAASTPTSGFTAPGETEMSDGHAFQEAWNAQLAWSTDNSRNPGRDPLSDAAGFQAAESARIERVTATPGHTPEPADHAEQARQAWNGSAPAGPLMEPSSDLAGFPSPQPSPLLEHSPLSFPPSPLPPVSPLPSSAVPTPNGQQPLLGSEGHAVLRDATASMPTASTSRTADSTRRSVSPAAGKSPTVPKVRRM